MSGAVWVSMMILASRIEDGLTWGWLVRVTLVIGAIAIPMVFVPDIELIKSRRRAPGYAVSTDLAYALVGVLYLFAVGALFWLMNLFL